MEVVREILNDESLQPTEEQQLLRAELREKFLQAITRLGGNECTVKMYEDTTVTCKLGSFDPAFENVVVEKLQTPVPPNLDRAILRTTDIISMEFELPAPLH